MIAVTVAFGCASQEEPGVWSGVADENDQAGPYLELGAKCTLVCLKDQQQLVPSGSWCAQPGDTSIACTPEGFDPVQFNCTQGSTVTGTCQRTPGVPR
jgi:hypothetical protein